MSSTILQNEADRKFEPGTTGWSAEDLDDPQFERFWQTCGCEAHWTFNPGTPIDWP